MNYPIWDVPGAGLLIAGIAVLHVFISHFAVGGGLLLVWLERRARRTADPALLAYTRRHSRFFVLLTLVLGALTGVGIWFTIALVHPQATSTLIQAFVWGWAIEWTFFLTEIAAALVYYYGWDRLDERTHLAVGWIYFIAAWLSLAVINGILSFMLTPGRWVHTYAFWDGILNPTYLPTLVARTAGAVGLAGAYALLTLAWQGDRALPRRIVRPLAAGWVLPGVVVLIVSLVWIAQAATNAGVPVAGTLGHTGIAGATASLFGTAPTGYPMARVAARVALDGMIATVLIAALLARSRGRLLSRSAAVALMAGALAVVGGLEWVREDLRKPYIIGNYMLLSGVRVDGAAPYTVDDLRRRGAIAAARWVTPSRPATDDEIAALDAQGEALFRLQCSLCHTRAGYLGVQPLVRGSGPAALERVLARLHEWRGRRMPPFTGTDAERHALAVHLALVGGAEPAALAGARAASAGQALFEEQCSACHGAGADYPFNPRGRSAEALYGLIGRLPQVNEVMPPFEGSDADRHALARYLETLNLSRAGGAQ